MERPRLTHGLQTQILIKFEVQQRLGWNSYLFTFGQDLGAEASCGTDGGADRRAFTASDNGADQSSKGRTAAHHDCRLLVRAHALPALLLQVAGAYEIPGSRNCHRIHIEHE